MHIKYLLFRKRSILTKTQSWEELYENVLFLKNLNVHNSDIAERVIIIK